ncbi:MAG: hypothetical protein FD143_2186 [Ignavibacteria bacterium]|nr:MAG: hypothetical protein FD143_2186 [Ignavibacteria bacterium]KAF0158661.1 MAG: hypothetical protein FD188_2468 [Ignavibacteria bacterium]
MQKDDENKVPLLNNLTAEQRLIESLRLYFLARELKKAALKTLEPNMSEEEIEKKVKEIFSNAKH